MVSAGALVAAGLAGCGGSSSARDGTTTVSIAVRAHFTEQMQQITAQYHKLHPEVRFTTQTLPDDNTQYLQRLVTARMGGKVPDVIESIDTLVNQLSSSKVTTDLTPYLARKENGVSAGSFLPQFLGAYRPLSDSGRVEGVPVGADTYVLYYNKDLFARYHVPLPTDSWTYDDMYAASKAITRAAKGKAFGMVQTDLQQGEYNPVIDAFGGYVYDKAKHRTGIGEPAAVKAWKYLLKPYQDGTFAPYEIGSSPSAPTFQSGRVAMLLGARKNVPTFRQQLDADWDVAPVPTIRGKRPIGGGSYGLAISSTSRHKDAAWSFLSWFYTEKGGETTLQNSYQILPATKAGITDGSWKSLPAPPTRASVFADAVTGALMAPQLPKSAQGTLTTALIAADQKVLLDGESVEDAFGAAADQVNAAIEASR
ncbi:ABC transporter substrate-binding protein [Streptomyces sp. NPDC050560]|uniref:ABC transporter substrate-binding protein n=1 Tax=Streptomyces sp. NPDC050560 TaxID=3365630 RepID=UPI00378FDA54